MGGVGNVDVFALQVAGQGGIFIFRIQHEDLGIVRCQIGQDALGGVGFTAAGLTHDDHVGIDTLIVPAEEVHKGGDPVGGAQVQTRLIVDDGIDPGEHRRQGTAGNADGLIQ